MDENPLRRSLEEQSQPEVYRNILIETAIKHGLPPNFLVNLQQIETPDHQRYDPRTKEGDPTSKGIRHQGILQFSPGMARQYGINPFDVYESADAAARLANENMATFKQRFPNLTPQQLLHLGAVAHNQGTAPIIAAGGKVPMTSGAQTYSKALKSFDRMDKSLFDTAIKGPQPAPPAPSLVKPPAPPPPAPRPAGAASQPVRKGSADIYDIQQMFSNVGEYLPGVDMFSRG